MCCKPRVRVRGKMSQRERGEGGGGGSREVKICENAWGSAFDL